MYSCSAVLCPHILDLLERKAQKLFSVCPKNLEKLRGLGCILMAVFFALRVLIFNSGCLCCVKNIHLDADYLKHKFSRESFKGLGHKNVPGLKTDQPFRGK